MSNVSYFMKKNKIAKDNVKFAATKSLRDENGEPLMWELKAITTKQDEALRDSCTTDVPLRGRPHLSQPKLNVSQYISKLLAESVVFPDLLDAELQDSYGVKTPEDLLKEMIDDPGEFAEFTAFVQKHNGFNITVDEMIEQAKN